MDTPLVNYHNPLQSYHDVGTAGQLEKTTADPTKKSAAERQSNLESFTNGEGGSLLKEQEAIVEQIVKSASLEAFDESDNNLDGVLTLQERAVFVAFFAENLQTAIDQIRSQWAGQNDAGKSRVEGKLAHVSSLSVDELATVSGLLDLLKSAISSRGSEGFPANKDDLVNELLILALGIGSSSAEPTGKGKEQAALDRALSQNPLAEEVALRGEA